MNCSTGILMREGPAAIVATSPERVSLFWEAKHVGDFGAIHEAARYLREEFLPEEGRER